MRLIAALLQKTRTLLKFEPCKGEEDFGQTCQIDGRKSPSIPRFQRGKCVDIFYIAICSPSFNKPLVLAR